MEPASRRWRNQLAQGVLVRLACARGAEVVALKRVVTRAPIWQQLEARWASKAVVAQHDEIWWCAPRRVIGIVISGGGDARHWSHFCQHGENGDWMRAPRAPTDWAVWSVAAVRELSKARCVDCVSARPSRHWASIGGDELLAYGAVRRHCRADPCEDQIQKLPRIRLSLSHRPREYKSVFAAGIPRSCFGMWGLIDATWA